MKRSIIDRLESETLVQPCWDPVLLKSEAGAEPAGDAQKRNKVFEAPAEGAWTAVQHAQKQESALLQLQELCEVEQARLGGQPLAPHTVPHPLPQSHVLRLVVGGQLFELPQELLMRNPHSYLMQLFMVQGDTPLVLDRPLAVFQQIETFLQRGRLVLTGMDLGQLHELRKEAEFFGLLDLVGQINVCVALQDPEQDELGLASSDECESTGTAHLSPPHIERTTSPGQRWTLVCSDKTGEVVNGGLTLRAKRMNGVIAFGSMGFRRGVHEFKVRYDGESDALRVGVAVRNHGTRYALRSTGGAARESNRPNVAETKCFRALQPGDLVSRFFSFGAVFLTGERARKICVRLDMNRRALTFGLNNQWNEHPAFRDLEAKVWYPYIKTGHKTSLTIIWDNVWDDVEPDDVF